MNYSRVVLLKPAVSAGFSNMARMNTDLSFLDPLEDSGKRLQRPVPPPRPGLGLQRAPACQQPRSYPYSPGGSMTACSIGAAHGVRVERWKAA